MTKVRSHPRIYLSRPDDPFTAPLGVEVDGHLNSLDIDEGKDTARSQNPPKPRTLDCGLIAPANVFGQGTYREGDLIECQVEDSIGTETWFKGFLDRPGETAIQGGRTRLNFRAFGLSALIAQQRVQTTLYAATNALLAIGYLLDAAGWPASHRLITDAGLSNVSLAYWWTDGRRTVAQELTALIETAGPPAQWYEDRQGRLVILGPAWVPSDTRPLINIDRHRPNAETDEDLSDVVNFAEYPRISYRAQTEEVIWENGQEELLTIGENRIRADVQKLVSSFTTPVLGTDFTLDTPGGVTVALENTRARSVDVVFTATANRTVSGLQIKGQLVEEVGRSASQDDDPDSIALHGGRPWRGRPWPTVERLQSDLVANNVITAYEDGINSRSIEVIVNDDDVYADYRQLAPLVPVSVAESGGAYSARVRSISWSWRNTTLVAQMVVDQDGGLLQSGAGPFILGLSMLDSAAYLWV